MSKPVFIKSNAKGYANPKCYLSSTNDCSPKISGEHCISHGLLNRIEKLNKTIDVVGLSWLPKDQLTSIGKKSLVSNILCEKHNAALSPLDGAVGDLVEAIGSIDTEYKMDNPVGKTFLIDGANLERWILKAMFGLVKSRQIAQHSGGEFEIQAKCLDLLCVAHAHWPIGWGLYIATPNKKIYHSSSFELLPMHNPETGELAAIGLKFNGIEMNFLMGKPDNPSAFGVRRPSKLIFRKGKVDSIIELNWKCSKKGQAITFAHAGVYSGDSPDHDWVGTK